MSKKFIYTVRRDSSDRCYHHIAIAIYGSDTLITSLDEPIIKFTWQGDPESNHWYAFRGEVELRHVTDEMAEHLKAAGKILAKLKAAGEYNPGPAALIAALGFDRMVEDSRENKYLPLADVKPADWRRYMAMVDGQCCVRALAENETSAVPLLMREFADRMERRSDYASRLEAWILGGKIVELDSYAKAPDVRPLAEILKPMKEPEVAVEEVAEVQAEDAMDRTAA